MNPDNEIIFNLCPFKALSTPVILDTVTGKKLCGFISRLQLFQLIAHLDMERFTNTPSGTAVATFILADASQSRRAAVPPSLFLQEDECPCYLKLLQWNSLVSWLNPNLQQFILQSNITEFIQPYYTHQQLSVWYLSEECVYLVVCFQTTL